MAAAHFDRVRERRKMETEIRRKDVNEAALDETKERAKTAMHKETRKLRSKRKKGESLSYPAYTPNAGKRGGKSPIFAKRRAIKRGERIEEHGRRAWGKWSLQGRPTADKSEK